MTSTAKLTPVVRIDEGKCNNCYSCITACPVKLCMDGSGEKLLINPSLCIGCGNCVDACSHNARLIIDDAPAFFEDLKRGVKVVAVVAPAIASFFPGKYLNFNGYLGSLGVDAAFDVSFGAELTVASYLDHIKEKNPKMVISQPCPAVVNFIQIYHPELLPHLAPVDSPMLHTIKMIREYYPQYRSHKVAVISPCIAKKREFDETGLADYNVTMLSLKNSMGENRLDINSFPQVEYAGPVAERAVRFSSPGGLLETAERFAPGIGRRAVKIEGVHVTYPYLEEVSKLLGSGIALPPLVDCLNCDKGCNGGPGTGNIKVPMVVLENAIRARSDDLEEFHKTGKGDRWRKRYNNLVSRYWKKGLYNRSYRDYSGNNNLRNPSAEQAAEIYRGMGKTKPEDLYDCTACGYGKCEAMAAAIFNNLNKPSNCAHYNITLLAMEKKTTIYINQQLKTHIRRALEVIESITGLVEKLNVSINTQVGAVEESSEAAGHVISALKDTSDLSRQKREDVEGLIANAAKGQEAMKETIMAVDNISESVDGIASTIKIISVIAANTNLLAMNAAIEAAHAGEAGMGFAVVADEIRRLSESTRENSRGISQTLSSIIAAINNTSKRTGDAGGLINEMSGEINGFAGTMASLIDTLGDLSEKSSSITNSLGNLREHSEAVKTDYTETLSLIDVLRYDINFLAAMSADIVKAIEEGDSEIISRLVALEQETYG